MMPMHHSWVKSRSASSISMPPCLILSNSWCCASLEIGEGWIVTVKILMPLGGQGCEAKDCNFRNAVLLFPSWDEMASFCLKIDETQEKRHPGSRPVFQASSHCEGGPRKPESNIPRVVTRMARIHQWWQCVPSGRCPGRRCSCWMVMGQFNLLVLSRIEEARCSGFAAMCFCISRYDLRYHEPWLECRSGWSFEFIIMQLWFDHFMLLQFHQVARGTVLLHFTVHFTNCTICTAASDYAVGVATSFSLIPSAEGWSWYTAFGWTWCYASWQDLSCLSRIMASISQVTIHKPVSSACCLTSDKGRIVQVLQWFQDMCSIGDFF